MKRSSPSARPNALFAARPLALALALTLPGCGAPDADPPSTEPFAGTPLATPLPRPAFALTDVATGTSFDFPAETRGRVALLFFGYTHCPDVCPVHMANLAAALRHVPREVSRQVQVVFVTTDPERDTPERLATWLAAIHPDFVGLRGTREEVTALERSLGLPASVVQPEGGAHGEPFVGHAAQVLAFAPDGPARLAYPWGTRQRDWVQDLPRLVGGGSVALVPASAAASAAPPTADPVHAGPHGTP